MVHIEVDLDPELVFMKPQQAIQQLSLIVLAERESLLRRFRGTTWNNSSTKGVVCDCSQTTITIELPDKTKKELPITTARLRQLLAATTTR